MSVWRARDQGDLSYWDQLRSVSDEAMGQWCDNAKQQIKQVDQGHNVSEEVWSKWLAVHNEIAERGVRSPTGSSSNEATNWSQGHASAGTSEAQERVEKVASQVSRRG